MTEHLIMRAFHADGRTRDWRVVGDGATAVFRTGSFAVGARLIQAIAAAVGDAGPHHPDVDLQHDTVTVRLITETPGYTGMTADDLELAVRISDLARALGLAADPALIQNVQVTVDALVSAAVMPFWAAVLGYERRGGSPDEDLVDPRLRGPSIWFQHMDAPRPQRNRLHIDVWVPAELAEARVAAALAAGGRMVRDASPTWWTLADAEGNEADVTSATGRD
jgi:4a-hydroxytetrahydrobiopterin dehydratase